MENLPEEAKAHAPEILAAERKILTLLEKITGKRISAMKIRIHGDYHLGQVLFTGNDFVIIDFEGEPARSLSERRLKRSPFVDVAGMMRSFHYASYTSLFKHVLFKSDDITGLDLWGDLWYKYVSSVFLRSYLNATKEKPFVSGDTADIEMILKIFLLEKAVYEVGYELNNRPDWVAIPLKGIKDLLEVQA